jgi:mono/diheme cytochrome c family protein
MITARKSHDDLLRQFSKLSNAVLSVACIVLLFSVLPAAAQQPPRPQRKGDKTAAKPIPSTQAEVARGKYIVENVAMCPQCHTARNSDGTLDHSRELEGAPEFFQPPYPDANWPLKAPRIGGNPPANDQDMIKLLTTGIWTDGKPLRLPMMPFRMSDADAKAVLAYLKSVKQQH